MATIEEAIEYLKQRGITAHDCSNILTVPCSSPEEICNIVSKLKSLLKEVGYQKSWSVDPYYIQRHESLTSQMFDESRE